jgi:hypothetical protein
MKKTLLLSVMALGSFGAMADCTVELQYQGTVLGQNTFNAPVCREAIRSCKRAQKGYERNHMLPASELACVKFDDVVVDPRDPTDVDNDNGGGHGQMSRYDAIRILEDAEGDSMQGEENFDIIMNYVNSRSTSLRDGVDTFITILSATGSNDTAAARDGFYKVMDATAQTNISPVTLSQQLSENIGTEGDSNQGIENFVLLVNLSVNNNLDPIETMIEFNKVLREVGINDTSNARILFNSLVTTKRVSTRLSVVVKAAIEIQRIEVNASQTAENIALVNKASKRSRVSFSEAKNTMIDLLNRHGASNTSTVQSKFRKIFNI